MPHIKRTVKERLLSKISVNSETGCWEWLGSLSKNGYGKFTTAHQHWDYAHRVSYQTFKGPIPEGHEIDHACHNRQTCQDGKACPHRRCINPEHLQVKTHRENTARANLNGTCKKGHDKQGRDACPTCYRQYMKEHRARVNQNAVKRYYSDLEKYRQKNREKEQRRRKKSHI